jgi:hypothetical protein
MTVIGFHFVKILAEKNNAATGKISVTNNLLIKEVKEAKVSLGETKQQKGAEFTFTFNTKYSPDAAAMLFEGAAVYIAPADKIKEVITKWNKDKSIPKEALEQVYNYILEKCNVEAIVIGKEMQLPVHIPMPKVTYKA